MNIRGFFRDWIITDSDAYYIDKDKKELYCLRKNYGFSMFEDKDISYSLERLLVNQEKFNQKQLLEGLSFFEKLSLWFELKREIRTRNLNNLGKLYEKSQEQKTTKSKN